MNQDYKRIIETNVQIFRAWFNSWLISFVPTLIERPKWFANDTGISVGDVVLFLKSDKELSAEYQYGIVRAVHISRDNLVRTIEVEYQNSTEEVKHVTVQSAREIVVIHRIDELPSC